MGATASSSSASAHMPLKHSRPGSPAKSAAATARAKPSMHGFKFGSGSAYSCMSAV